MLCKDVLEEATQQEPGGTEHGACGSWLGSLKSGM